MLEGLNEAIKVEEVGPTGVKWYKLIQDNPILFGMVGVQVCLEDSFLQKT